ncbi:1-phosphofructokinase [Chloroflexus aggregans]|uniref:1-phosphofructokinase n=1 Tax=Chloroflexus aggregans (strain MD-66 / DSM 9485) TaxID=326427 RepID=B8G624_CHLAD|nr:1-phosphofructokinase [Chloroflexus aggregans]ACL25757.1 1-phosphofructokinase [Chloroflexus aggregans DSM 9485]
MKIATITLNPAIDQTVFVDHFQPNTVNQARAMQRDAGGKGVNVASFLADFGLNVTATGLLGAENPHIFERHFAAKRIADRFVRVPGATRIGVKIVDEANQQTTDINLPGSPPPPGALDALLAVIDELAVDHEWFVLAGKLPPGVPVEFVPELVARLCRFHRAVALDVSGPALAAGLSVQPALVKPNLDELRQIDLLAGDGLEAAAVAARRINQMGVPLVIVSMGAQGAIFSEGTTMLHAAPPPVTVKSTVGAGDAMVAGTIAGLVEGLTLAEIARRATAFSLAALGSIGAHLPPRAELMALAAKVVVTEVDPVVTPVTPAGQ